MTRVLGFISLLLVLLVGAWLYTSQIKAVTPGVESGPASPKQAVDLTGVKMDLLQFAKAEQQHLATDGHYVSLEEMRNGGDTGLPADGRGPYTYSIDASDSSFEAIATYQGTPPAGVPARLTVGPDGTVSVD